MARAYIGTSGWHYPGWRGAFYPDQIPAGQFLSYYATHFDTAEINSTFYRLPRASTYEKWRETVGRTFVFAVKAPRLITHVKRLDEVEAEWERFIAGACLLADKLGPILLQFPPSFQSNPENLRRLETFLGFARREMPLRLALEFRHRSCLESPVVELLGRFGATVVVAHSSRYPVATPVAVAPFAYFRFHGPRELFASAYSHAELANWSRVLRQMMDRGLDVYAYFNNDARGDAVPNALTLRALLTGRTLP